MTTRIATQRATGREWAGLAVLALPTLLLSVDIFVLLLALPRIDLVTAAAVVDSNPHPVHVKFMDWRPSSPRSTV